MHYTYVELKDGQKLCGPIWIWRAKEGWFQLAFDVNNQPSQDAPDKIYFRDVLSGYTENERVAINRIEDQDIIKRACDEGWDGT